MHGWQFTVFPLLGIPATYFTSKFYCATLIIGIINMKFQNFFFSIQTTTTMIYRCIYSRTTNYFQFFIAFLFLCIVLLKMSFQKDLNIVSVNFDLKYVYFYRTVKNCQALSKYSEWEWSAVKKLHQLREVFVRSLTSDQPLFWVCYVFWLYCIVLYCNLFIVEKYVQIKV